MSNKLICIVGPTATGKSDLGIILGKKLNAQIISGDSMLVYKKMDIGTAKPNKNELEQIPHHLIDILSPDQEYSVAMFQQQASALIEKINNQGKLPLLVGGTGLYVKALLEGYQFAQTAKSDLRCELEKLDNKELFCRLYSLAPQIADSIHPNNKKRLVRALELELSGQSLSRQKQKEPIYDAFVIGLIMDRQKLYQRINERVDKMFDKGLVQEVKNLLHSGISPDSLAMQAIGYKEVIMYLNGEINLQTCKDMVAQNTRHFAKRQITWYKKMPYINWYELDEINSIQKIADNIYIKLEKKFNLS